MRDSAKFIIADIKPNWWSKPEYSVVFDNKNKDYKV
jgi:hypothetical protein